MMNDDILTARENGLSARLGRQAVPSQGWRVMVLQAFDELKPKPERVQLARLQQITGHRFFNLSRMQSTRLQEYRTSLITAAVTGKIDVRTIDHGE